MLFEIKINSHNILGRSTPVSCDQSANSIRHAAPLGLTFLQITECRRALLKDWCVLSCCLSPPIISLLTRKSCQNNVDEAAYSRSRRLGWQGVDYCAVVNWHSSESSKAESIWYHFGKTSSYSCIAKCYRLTDSLRSRSSEPSCRH